MWIAAAKWEMEDNLSMENARALLQRGLRFNPQSKLLWQEVSQYDLLTQKLIHQSYFPIGTSIVKLLI